MTRMLQLRWFGIWLAISLPLLSGCASDSSLMRLQDRELRPEKQVNQNLTAKIEHYRMAAKVQKENTFQRQLSLTFTASDHKVTALQEKLIKLFFQTLPSQSDIKIVISVAPSSTLESFAALQSAWQRLRSLEQAASSYSKKIELIYQPALKKDTATMKVTGGGSV